MLSIGYNKPHRMKMNSVGKEAKPVRKFFLYLLLMIVAMPSLLCAQTDRIICYGNDLTPEEQRIVGRDFPLPPGLTPDRIKSLKVTNEEERQLLQGLIPDEQIGTRAVTAVYLEQLTGGAGIKVQTKNLTDITPHIFANALATAGVTDANVFATAPHPVSGTNALTGIYQCFETLTNRTLSAYAKRIAAEELIVTGNLGEKSGKEETAIFIERTKEKVITARTATKPEVLKIIQQAAGAQNLKLSDVDQDKLADLLLKIDGLNLNPGKLQAQLKNYTQVQEPKPAPVRQSFLAKIIAFIQSLFKQLFSFVGRILLK